MVEVVGLKELRANVGKYAAQTMRGKRFLIVRRSKPLFVLAPPDEESDMWETVINFTKLRRGGVPMRDILARL